MFKSELELQNTFIYLMEKQIKNNEYISDEFNARFGNVDIVKVKYENSVPLSKQQALILSNIASAKIVGYLHKNSIRTLNYLKKNSGYTYDYILSIISKLKSANIIIELPEKKYLINSQFEFPQLVFTAYEAKLSDWKKAISQALKNKNFSSLSYIVMPTTIAKRISKTKINYFTSYNIGLISVSDNNFEILIKPKNCKRNSLSQPQLISSVAKYLILKNQVA